MEIHDCSGQLLYSSNHLSLGETLQEAVRMRVPLWGADLRESELKDLTLYGPMLGEADFANAEIENVIVVEGTLEKTRFINARLLSLGVVNSDISRANFSGSKISGTYFEATNMVRAKFEAALINQAMFRNVNAQRVQFDHATIDSAAFVWADLKDSSFYSAEKMKQVEIHFSTVLPGGTTWGEFLTEVVPTLHREIERGAMLPSFYRRHLEDFKSLCRLGFSPPGANSGD